MYVKHLNTFLAGGLLFAVASFASAAEPAADASRAREGGAIQGASVQTLTIAGTGMGMIPPGPGTPTACGPEGPPRDISFTVPTLVGELVDLDVEVTFSPAHTWAGDVTAVLISPGGARRHTLFGRVGAISAASCGQDKRLVGPYIFSDSASPPFGGFWQAASQAGSTTPIQSGSYFATDSGGAGAVSPMPSTSLAATFSGMQSWQMQGTWTLRVTDGSPEDSGGVGAAALRIRYRGDGAEIYSNGPLATGSVTDSGVTAPAGYQWSELQMDDSVPGVANSITGVTSARWGTVAFRVADDFTVPEGQAWTLTHAGFPSFVEGHGGTSSPIDLISLRIWDGPPMAHGSNLLCGDTATNLYQGAQEMGLLRVPNTQVGEAIPDAPQRIWLVQASIPAACSGHAFFGPGTYWLDWNTRAPGVSHHYTPTVAIPGVRSRSGDNARHQNYEGVWTQLSDKGKPWAEPAVPVAFPFKLYGSRYGSEIFANGFE